MSLLYNQPPGSPGGQVHTHFPPTKASLEERGSSLLQLAPLPHPSDRRPSRSRWAHTPPTSATQTAAAGAQSRSRPHEAPNQRAAPRPRRAPARWAPGAGACALRALVRDSWRRQLPGGWRRRPRRPGARLAAGSRSSRRPREEERPAPPARPSSLLEMAGEITETGELYSPYVGLVYMFNLIVGTGALTMPKAFASAGWLVSLFLLVFLGFMSFVTTTFVVEAMAAANAQLHWKRMENHQEEDDSSSTASDSDSLVQDNYERAEKRPILSVQRRGSPNLFEITDRVEMGQMASMFFSKVGVNLFYFCIIIYLYGDLAIYAAAVPFSLMQVSCSATGNDSCGVEADTKYNDTDLCWGPLRRGDVYRVYLAVFTLLLGPFTFFDVQKTKYLQILTSLMRWVAFAIMIVLALVRIGRGHGEGHPPLADLSGVRNLFGVCVYSFMCQHSLPSLLTPVSSKRHLTRLVFLDYVLILAFYSLLSFTAIFSFRGDSLLDMYTLNFASCDIVSVAAVRFFLGLFPVFTISTNFPIIAVTLRNNWKTLFHREGGTYPWVVDRVVFPTITLVPPVLVAFCTHDLESLVGITGAYAGTGIQYVIPAFLVYLCRKDTQLALGPRAANKHRSPFHHTFWVGFVLLWAFSCFFFVTANIILSETKI